MQEILTKADNDFEAPQPPEPVLAGRPTPNDPPWNSGVAVGTWFLSVLMILVIPGIVLLPYILSVSGGFADNVELAEFIKTDTTAIILQLDRDHPCSPDHYFSCVACRYKVAQIFLPRDVGLESWRHRMVDMVCGDSSWLFYCNGNCWPLFPGTGERSDTDLEELANGRLHGCHYGNIYSSTG